MLQSQNYVGNFTSSNLFTFRHMIYKLKGKRNDVILVRWAYR